MEVEMAAAAAKLPRWCDMGGMSLDNYVYYIAILGVICGLAFVLGMNQKW